MTLKEILSPLLDFLFPKNIEVYELESLSSQELSERLLPAKDLGENAIAVWNYADPNVRNLIWEIKYRKNDALIERISLILFDVIKTELLERSVFDNFKNPLLIPVPISDERRRERGYNQTELLCEVVKKLDTENLLEYSPNFLEKIRHTDSQTKTKNKKKRLENLVGSTKASSKVSGRNIILIDDVTTTGATLSDARRALRESGAKKILAITLAH